MNVLILGMGSNVSQGIVKALRNIKNIPINIIGACINRTSVGLYLCDEALLMPLAADNDFIPWYIDTCNSHNIDITFTGVEENINALVKNREKVEAESRACFVYPDRKVWEIGFDKYSTCQWLKDNAIPYPDYALASDDKALSELIVRSGFPLIAKPRSGKSSTGIICAHSLKDLMGVVGSEEYVIQECVGSSDDEYTIGCYFSKSGELVSRIIFHRYLKNGGTSMAEIVQNDIIDELIYKIADKLHVTGPLNIQVRLRKDGTPVCFEWNVRYSGATAMRNYFGFCDVEAAVREYVLQEDIEKCFHMVDRGAAVRVENEIYFDNSDFKQMYVEKNI